MGQILTISDFRYMYDFRPALWPGRKTAQPDWAAGLGWAGLAWPGSWTRLGWVGLPEASGLARRPDWAGLAELSESWQGVVKWWIQAPTGITHSMDQCSPADM